MSGNGGRGRVGRGFDAEKGGNFFRVRSTGYLLGFLVPVPGEEGLTVFLFFRLGGGNEGERSFLCRREE